ncbi:MAG: histidinol dehydrogenase, partial [Oscillospiraceae bacterium]|nr:histidinol dehydrogenase [Oscillospiraceae bacterium]
MSLIEIVKANGAAEKELFAKLRARSEQEDARVTAVVREILREVARRGDAAVAEYTAKFDCEKPAYYEVPRDVIEGYADKCDAKFISALRRAADNISDFHRRQVTQSWLTAKDNGVIMGQRVRGLSRVGVYVPGGTAAYPSSVLMNVIPAKIAGVKEIIMATPPGKDGSPQPTIMAAAAIAGADRVFLMGGAQAVGALAYGTDNLPRVDKIVGPGNIYVATAK